MSQDFDIPIDPLDPALKASFLSIGERKVPQSEAADSQYARIRAPRNGPQDKRSRKALWATGAALIAVLTLCLLLVFQRNRANEVGPPLRQSVRISILSDEGRPVGGARIFIAGSAVGSSDAFGQWRGMRMLQQSKPIRFQVVKGALKAERSLILPPGSQALQEWKVSLSLRDPGAIASVSSQSTGKIAFPEPTAVDAAWLSNLQIEVDRLATRVESLDRRHSRVMRLKDAIGAAAKARGMRLDENAQHSLRLRLLFQLDRGVPAPEMLQVTGSDRRSGETVYSFLLVETADSQALAESILRNIERLTSQGLASGPQRVLRLGNSLPQDLVYVAGDLASRGKSGIWGYFPGAKRQLNLTVVRGRQLLLRSQVKPLAGRIPLFALPVSLPAKIVRR